MISIITAYYNRKELFYRTLRSISKSLITDYEIIVVDDGSNKDNQLDDLCDEFSKLKIIKIKNKQHINPCVPFNIGISIAQGNILILQNPECFHLHDVLAYVKNNIALNNYLSISAYSFNQDTMSQVNFDDYKELEKTFKNMPQIGVGGSQYTGWFNHSKYRPKYFHFCAALTKENMNKLNGFDERYAYGISFDDAEFIQRVKRLGLDMINVDDVSVIHQFHPTVFYNQKNFKALHAKNKKIYNKKTLKETIIKVNI